MNATAVTATEPVPLAGVWPAMLTPLDAALDIDIARFAAHARALLDAGCTGVTPFGTTGEGPSFTVRERRAALEGLVAGGVPANRIMVSTSCAALPDVIELTRHAVELGVKACLVLPPFFMKGVPEQGVVDAYARVIDGVADSRLRVMLYHIPQISGVPLGHAVVSALLRRYEHTIVGLKDSGCQREVSLGYAQAFMPPLQVWVGNEPDLQTLAAHGSRGAISGVANVAPRLVSRLIESADRPGAATDQQRVLALLGLLGGYALVPAFKVLMAQLSGHAGWRRVRPTLVALSDLEAERLLGQWQGFGLDRQKD